DWSLLEKHADIHRFTTMLIDVRMNRHLSTGRADLTLNELLRAQPVEWHGVKLNAPDWSDKSHTLAATVQLLGYPIVLHLIVNAFWEPLEFEVPRLGEAQDAWRRCIDTYLDAPDDICRWDTAPLLKQAFYRVQPRSVVALIARHQTELS